MTNNDELVLTVKEVSESLKVSRVTVFKWIDEGHLVADKLPSGQWRIQKQSYESLLSFLPSSAQ